VNQQSANPVPWLGLLSYFSFAQVSCDHTSVESANVYNVTFKSFIILKFPHNINLNICHQCDCCDIFTKRWQLFAISRYAVPDISTYSTYSYWDLNTHFSVAPTCAFSEHSTGLKTAIFFCCVFIDFCQCHGTVVLPHVELGHRHSV
jgi:hypothetical protein